jgi:arylsulfatase A-like enzyme
MTHRRPLLNLLALLAATAFASAADKPNIVIILADDIGYGDLGCYGAKHAKTPNLDRLAKEGRRFTDAHSPASTCTPTRRALLTGTYSWRQKPASAIAPGDAPLGVEVGTPTIASLLHEAGYKNGHVGKWHIGLGGDGGPDWNGDIKPGPLELGFDYTFMMPATGDRVPTVYVENHRILGLDPADPIRVSYQQKVGTEPTGAENPALLKLKHTHGHDMTIVNGVGRIGWMTGGKAARWKDEDMADTFAKKAIGFIETNKSGPFFLYLATHGIHVPRVPNPRFVGSSGTGTRSDAIQELDDTVGQVLAALDRLKLAENTLVIFSSDNGGVIDDGYEDFGQPDVACNGVLRGYKGTLWEGGHRVPFLARWPAKIPAGTENGELLALLDLPATFAALTGVNIPANGALDSMNVLPALLGLPHDKPARTTFITHTGGIQGPFAVRRDGWKLVTGGGGRRDTLQGASTNWPQLYDVSKDVEEKNEVSAQHPEIVQELKALVAKQREQGRTR